MIVYCNNRDSSQRDLDKNDFGQVPPHLMDHFQDLISALVSDVKKIEYNNKLLEEKYEK